MPSCPTASNVSDECDTSGHYTLQFYDYVTGLSTKITFTYTFLVPLFGGS